MRYSLTNKLLLKLEELMKSHNLWSLQQPEPQALASTAPFACDTLSFEQWLQFIFLSKMSQLVANKHPLPKNMAIAPMAEQTWQQQPQYQPIIRILIEFDELINES